MLVAVTEPAVTVPAVIPVVAVITPEKSAVEPVIPPGAVINPATLIVFGQFTLSNALPN